MKAGSDDSKFAKDDVADIGTIGLYILQRYAAVNVRFDMSFAESRPSARGPLRTFEAVVEDSRSGAASGQAGA